MFNQLYDYKARTESLTSTKMQHQHQHQHINEQNKKSIRKIFINKNNNNIININKPIKTVSKCYLNLNKLKRTVPLLKPMSVLFLIFNLFILTHCHNVKYDDNFDSNERNIRLSTKLSNNELNNQNHRISNDNNNNHHILKNDTFPKSTHQKQFKQHHKMNKNQEELEKHKNEALIDVFKLKLLKLLGVDIVPNPSQFNITKNPVPEPILREYNRLVRMSQSEKNRKRNSNLRNKLYRGLRDLNSDELERNREVRDEEVRFNGSVVQQITLLPKKLVFDDYLESDQDSDNQINENSWCRDFYNQKLMSKKQKYYNLFDSIWPDDSKNQENTQSDQERQAYTTLNCLTFALEQNEFKRYEINKANIYIKLDLNSLSDLAFSPDLMFGQNQKDADYVSNLYIQVNGQLVKKINLKNIITDYIKNSQYNSLDQEKSNGAYFDLADVKDIIEDEIYKKITENSETAPVLRVKIYCKSGLFNFTSSEEGLKNLFSTIDENMALHVKFGDELPYSLTSNLDEEDQYDEDNENVNVRFKRSAGGSTRRSNPKHHVKNYRDCADLRKAGFSSSNYSCCRETITFSMEQLGWSHWILSPKIIEYKYCRGGCLTGISPRFDNTQIVYKMFELSHTFESAHCCNIYDYEDDIPFIYGSPPNYLTKMVSLNAKNCLCS